MSNQSNNDAIQEMYAYYSVDSFSNGIAFGGHHLPAHEDPRDHLGLQLDGDDRGIKLRSRYLLHKDSPLYQLELQLKKLSKQGILGNAHIHFGVTTDPFHPFEGKFDASMRFLELFTKYTPGLLTVQTRSPLLVIAMPVFKRLGDRANVCFGIETQDESVVHELTPSLPRVAERLKAIQAFRRFGVPVSIQVHPVLPYGDRERDARAFAKLLVDHADSIHIRPLVQAGDKQVGNRLIQKKLAQKQLFTWLRNDAAEPLINAIQELAPEKLERTKQAKVGPLQLGLFAA